jgi:hypothetical protein
MPDALGAVGLQRLWPSALPCGPLPRAPLPPAARVAVPKARRPPQALGRQHNGWREMPYSRHARARANRARTVKELAKRAQRQVEQSARAKKRGACLRRFKAVGIVPIRAHRADNDLLCAIARVVHGHCRRGWTRSEQSFGPCRHCRARC